MPPNRPTFSESWYRVSEMKPALRTTVQTFRQFYRGRSWTVVRDPSNNQFFRLNDASYFYVGLLDGHRTVAQAWNIANEQLGDRAPTQNEVIQLLGQLYNANLLVAEIPADSAGLFDRYKKKIRREVTGYLTNILFARVPLWDPDNFLNRWVNVVGFLFGPVGLIGWLILLLAAGVQLAGRFEELMGQAQGVISPEKMLRPDAIFFMYAAMIFTKALHELGHGFAAKKFGRDTHSGGEVHTIGIMFLVFMPVPYVDASSAWALRNKFHRAFIGAAGMYVELAVAAVAVFVWANTSIGHPVNTLAFNAIFIASVSTILFNGNPLLRFDGYYILSDLLEIPNLSQRSKDYVYFLVKRYIYGADQARHPMLGPGEKPWLIVFFFASTIYRIIISVGIFLFVWYLIPFFGMVLALFGIAMWVCVPTGKFLHYLATNQELMKTRPRAIFVTVAFIGFIAFLILGVPVPEFQPATGVVESSNVQIIYATESGFVQQMMDGDRDVSQGGSPLVVLTNEELVAERRAVRADRDLIRRRHLEAYKEDLTYAQALKSQLDAKDAQLEELDRRIEALRIKAPFDGRWLTRNPEHMNDRFVKRGQEVGMVASVDDMIIRIAANQAVGPRLKEEVGVDTRVTLRIDGRAEDEFTGTVTDIPGVGQSNLPSAALGYLGGGEIAVSNQDRSGTQTSEAFFEVVIKPDAEALDMLRSGQRVVARFQLPDRPLGLQWYRAFRQMIEARF